MADMNLTAAKIVPQQWTDEFFDEYVNDNQFAPYMGTSENSIIQMNEDLTRKPGDTVTFAALRRLVGAGVKNNQILEGNEEIIDQHAMTIKTELIRHAVAVSDYDEQRNAFDLLKAGRPLIRNWFAERMRTDTLLAFTGVSAVSTTYPNGIPYAAATAPQRDAWLGWNSDRILIGSQRSNLTSTMAASLLNVDTTADRLTGKAVSLAKRIAKMANPHIRPYMVKKGGQKWYVLFAPPLAFRDFKNDPDVLEANKMAMPRSEDNPIFTDGDLVWDGVIVREIEELPVLAGAGATGSDVSACYLCGAQALGLAWTRRWAPISNSRDYGQFTGVGGREFRGLAKLRFGRNPADDSTSLVDQGMVTLFVSTPADA